jgi:hypothetical protein
MRGELMGRSGNLSGASVALDLLPKDFPARQLEKSNIILHGPAIQASSVEAALAAISVMEVESPSGIVALGPLAAFADLTAPFSASSGSDGDVADLAAGRLAEALGRQLCALIGQSTVETRQIYRMALALAGLNRSVEAHALMTLAEFEDTHPSMLALRGYLSFQVGEAETGRRALARAALASRGDAKARPILHFTQHVLLVHQFGG